LKMLSRLFDGLLIINWIGLGCFSAEKACSAIGCFG
jgi:hypothetical protein